MKKSFLIQPQFFPQAQQLRNYFDLQFENPHRAQEKRFVWDYWYVRDQYRHMRTPAYHYFPKKVYQDFHRQLVFWGRENLGCHDISPPWLSYYVDGHYQKLHADVPHGPWAFVYSLTLPRRKFSGGQTILMKDSVLDYWNNFQGSGRESKDFFDEVQPNFNQLLVFDARYPHGVAEVQNVQDPLEGRLVIHGWFVEPRPYIVGGLKTSQVQKVLGLWIAELSEWLTHRSSSEFLGTLTLRLKINTEGLPEGVEILTNTLKHLREKSEVNELQKYLTRGLKELKLPSAGSSSLLTIPLIFK